MYTLLKELQLFVINISNKSTDYYICAIHYFHQVTCFAKRNHMTITCLHNWKVHLHTICTLVLHGISVHGGCRRFSSELRPCMNSLFTQNASKMHDLITLKKQQKMYSSDVQHIGKILWKHVCKQLNILSFNWFLFAKKITDVLFRWTH